MDADRLHEYIWQGIRKEVLPDRINLHLPFCFGPGDGEPLCLTWDAKGTLSDGGRTIAELKRRIGDIRPYMNSIIEILAQCGDCRLVGGQMIVKDHFQTVICGNETYLDYLGGMHQMLKAISWICVVDTLDSLRCKEVSQ